MNAWTLVGELLDVDTAKAIAAQNWSKVASLWDTDTATAIQSGNWKHLGELIDVDTAVMIRKAMASTASEADIIAASSRDDLDFLDDVKISQHEARVQYGGDGVVG